MKKTLFLMASSVSLLALQVQSNENLPTKIVKPQSLKQERGNKKAEFTVDHPFNRALISAFNTNPQLRAKVKEQYAAAESVAQAQGGWRPSIKLQGTVGRSWSEVQSPLANKSSAWATPKTAQLSFQQNLFNGGQTVANVSQAEANVYAGFAALASAEQQIMLAAVNAYLDLWSKRMTLELNRNNVEVKQKTLNQTRARYEVGEVTLTDLSQAESGLAQAIAQRMGAEAEVSAAEQVYLQVIGEMPGDVPPPPPLHEVREMPKNQHELEIKAFKNHPDIRAAEFMKKAAESGIDIATSALLPSIDFNANAGRSLQSGSTKESRSNSASFGVTVTVPLYQQGNEWSKIRQASQQAAKAKIDVVTTRREVIKEAMKNWSTWQAAAIQIEQIKVQIGAAKVALEGVRQENLVGERTLLEVLQAENNLLQAETSLVTAQKTYLGAGYSILVAMGELSAIELGLPVDPYPVKENYERVRTQIIGTSDYPTR